MQAPKVIAQALIAFSMFLSLNCTPNNSSSFSKNQEKRSTVDVVQQSDVTKGLESSGSKAKIEAILDGNILNLMEVNLEIVRSTIKNQNFEYNGHEFYDLEYELLDVAEYMREQGIGQDLTVRELLEEEGISVDDFRAGKVPQEYIEKAMDLSSAYFEKGSDLFSSDGIKNDDEMWLAMAGCNRASRTRSRAGGICPRGPVEVNCKAAGEAQKIAGIVGGVCGTAGVACTLGAIPTGGLACTGLALCGAAASATSGGASIAKAVGGC